MYHSWNIKSILSIWVFKYHFFGNRFNLNVFFFVVDVSHFHCVGVWCRPSRTVKPSWKEWLAWKWMRCIWTDRNWAVDGDEGMIGESLNHGGFFFGGLIYGFEGYYIFAHTNRCLFFFGRSTTRIGCFFRDWWVCLKKKVFRALNLKMETLRLFQWKKHHWVILSVC